MAVSRAWATASPTIWVAAITVSRFSRTARSRRLPMRLLRSIRTATPQQQRMTMSVMPLAVSATASPTSIRVSTTWADQIDGIAQDALLWDEEEGAYNAARDGEPSRITGVADGELSETSTDAVNGSQLYETNQRVDEIDGRVTTIE